MKRSSTLKRELITLKEQREELAGTGAAPPSPTTNSFIKENDRLQVNTNTMLLFELQHITHFIFFLIPFFA